METVDPLEELETTYKARLTLEAILMLAMNGRRDMLTESGLHLSSVIMGNEVGLGTCRMFWEDEEAHRRYDKAIKCPRGSNFLPWKRSTESYDERRNKSPDFSLGEKLTSAVKDT